MNRPATVFLVVHAGYPARYLLRTDILGALMRARARVVILTPNATEEYFRKEFERDGIAVERLNLEACTAYYGRSRIRRQFIRLRANTLSSAGDLITLDDKNADFRRALAGSHPGEAMVMRTVLWALRRSRWLRHALISLESRLFPGDLHAELFRTHRPDLVVTTSLGYPWSDFLLMREAKRHGAKTLAVVLSWDNPSSKGLGGAHPDHVVAWTETMKRELIDYLDIDPGDISVCGVAHWDVYHRPHADTRAAFLERFGLDPGRRIILFGTKSPRPYPNHEIVEILGEAIAQDRFSVPCQLLVRVHPGYFEPGVEPMLAEMMAARDRYPHVRYAVPEVLSRKLVLDMPASEMRDLDEMLRYSDVLVNLFSTLSIEAAICDLPVVNVVFDGRESGPRLNAVGDPYRPIAIDEKQVHNRRIVESGGVSMARDPSELVDMISAYLADPGLHREGRAAIVDREAGPNRGRAGESVAGVALSLLRDRDR